MVCCGKEICGGCLHAPLYDDQGNKIANDKCPFCRIPFHDSEEKAIERLQKRVQAGDAKAIYNLGYYYRYGHGENGFPQDYTKALELFHQAGQLGYAAAYCSIGYAYQYGHGVEVQNKKAMHYYELAAIGGGVQSRHNLGIMEKKTGNMERALRHFIMLQRVGLLSHCRISKVYTHMDMQQKKITQKHYDRIKHTWTKLRVNREMKLLLIVSVVIMNQV